MKKKVFLVAGARPNFMKIAPIARAFNSYQDNLTYELIHTGQHYDRDMSEVFFDELQIPAPDHHLGAGSGSHAEQTARIMIGFESICQENRPDLVLVVGDVNSTLACSIVAKKLGILVGHIEAGLRSGDRAMPEEINRIVTDSISDYFFVTEQSGIDNLVREGQPSSRIFFVGHVMIDNLFYQLDRLQHLDMTQASSTGILEQYRDFGVVTLHRPANVDNKHILQEIIGALSVLSNDLPLIFPMHPRTAAKLKEFDIGLPATLIATKPMSYMDFLNLFSRAKLVLTDSGGLQEETTALGIPCLTLRENTERPVTVSEGTNRIVGYSREKILSEAQRSLREPKTSQSRPALWDGRAAERIVTQLVTLLSDP